ncbi:MAG: hypothetical protein Q7U02_05010 [Desulfosalsimonadaceae bacterium]|nr:hypothetical protein [Desulfosalsimonadaceae bacterium]
MKKINGSDMIKSEKKSVFRAGPWFWAFFLLAALIGGFLRCYLISDQVILDDEWHALNFTITHTLWYLLTHFSYAGANIIPVNAYVRMLLVSPGWSEILLVLPSLVAGIAGLLVFPLVLKRIFSGRVTIFFAILLAVSPLIIFYSRVCRPYSMYTFLGFLCIWILYEWSLTGNKRFGLLFALTGVLCIYFHFVGVIFVFVPLGCVIIVKLMSQYSGQSLVREQILPGFKELITAGCGMLICLAILLTAAIIQRLPAMNVSPAHFTFHSILGLMKMLSGTACFSMNILFYALFGIGLIRLFRKSFLLGFMFISVFAAYAVVSLVTKSNFAHIPLVLARYIIPAFPMAYILVALGLDSLWKTADVLPANKTITNAVLYGVAGCFLAGLFWTGPLRQTYASPNNFTNHSAFQESYASTDWAYPRISEMIQRRYAINKNTISAFYKTLAGRPEVKKIIEYPMSLGNHFNLFYYYQRVHGKQVAVGYTRAVKDPPDVSTGGIYGNMIADQILSQVKDPGQLKFRNMVDVLDMAAVKNSGADLVVFHKNTEAELFGAQTGDDGREVPLVSAVSGVYRKIFGRPVFEDNHLVVFRVSLNTALPGPPTPATL